MILCGCHWTWSRPADVYLDQGSSVSVAIVQPELRSIVHSVPGSHLECLLAIDSFPSWLIGPKKKLADIRICPDGLVTSGRTAKTNHPWSCLVRCPKEPIVFLSVVRYTGIAIFWVDFSSWSRERLVLDLNELWSGLVCILYFVHNSRPKGRC